MKKHYYHHKLCNFCKFKKRREIYSFGRQNLVQCAKCKLVYLDNQRIDLEELYNNDYYSSEEGTTANYADYQTQEGTIKKNFAFAYSYITKKSRKKRKHLFEIGPGFGYFLKNLPPSIVYDGIEVSKEAVLHMKKMGIKTRQGDFLRFSSNQKYDVIVAFDVIEHQIHIRQYLQKVLQHLKPGGVFIFTTPDFNSLPNRLFGKRAPTIQTLYHNYYFDKQWFLEQMPKIGFEIISIKTVYLAHLSIGQILLMASFAAPIIKKFPLHIIARTLHIDTLVIPFIRFGGIECIMQKV